jgi:DtxR family Mn-dependent transcriptional regulator
MTDLIDTTEMYLKSIFELEEDGVVPMRARIAERLGHSGPTVSQTVARMERDGLLTLDDERHLQLTDLGRLTATRVMRKHRLAERLLVDVIGLELPYVHDEACRWEHVISDEVEARLVEVLGHPTTCPHGNPIPGTVATEEERGVVPLTDIDPGGRLVLRRVIEQVELDQEAISYLAAARFMPGAGATVKARAPDGTLTLDIDGQLLALGPALAGSLFVSKL